jgi:hypothetical protein
VIITSATTGQILWRNGIVVERDIGRLEDGFAPPGQIRDGWNPYTSFQVVSADSDSFGQLMTYTSSSWGGRRALQNLVSMYRLKGRRQFPICTLETKVRKNDKNGNIDPVFKVIGWSDRGNFGELLALPDASGGGAPAIEHQPAKTSTAELIGDNIPFAWAAALISCHSRRSSPDRSFKVTAQYHRRRAIAACLNLR